jgi:hypothetical protein
MVWLVALLSARAELPSLCGVHRLKPSPQMPTPMICKHRGDLSSLTLEVA